MAPSAAPTDAAPVPPTDPVARYESAVVELETLVSKLERGDAPLDEALGLFERGMALVAQCRAALDHAELRVKNLLSSAADEADDPTEDPVEDDDDLDEDADDEAEKVTPGRR